MAIGDPKTDTLADKRRRRRSRVKNKVSENKKSYSPGFFDVAITFLNKTPREAGLFDAHPKSAKGRAKAKETSRTTTVSDEQKASSQVRKKSSPVRNGEKDISKNEDAAPSKSSGKKLSKFQQAFADARKAGKRTFRFTTKDGKTTTYTTRLKTESKDAFEKKFKKGKK